MDNFLSRLQWVLGEQDKYPWCERIGVGAGRGNTMFGTRDKAGAPPTAEGLNAIRHYENISTLWLLEGKGAPCLVTTLASDEAGARQVHQLLDGQDWDIHIVTDHLAFAVVLTRPGQYQVKDRTIDCTDVEILAGALAGKTMTALHEGASSMPAWKVEVDGHTLADLVGGRISNLKLLREGPALLDAKRPLADEDPLWQWPPAATVLLAPDEEQLLQHFRAMNRRQRATLLRIGLALQQEDEHGG